MIVVWWKLGLEREDPTGKGNGSSSGGLKVVSRTNSIEGRKENYINFQKEVVLLRYGCHGWF
jgi:hypothetical protein